MRRRTFVWIAAACTLVLFAAGNTISALAFKGARLDLTEGRLFSLSPGTIEVIESLSEPIDVTLFYSRSFAQEFPSLRAYAARVREMLEGYAQRSNGRIRLEIVDPAPFSEDEDRAIAAGLQGAPNRRGDTIYFGLSAVNALDERATVPFFDPDAEASLEYELTRLISELETPSRGRIALITSLPLETGPRGGASAFAPGPTGLYIHRQLTAAFDVEYLDRDFTQVPSDADLVLIAHPWAMSETQLYAVDQFVLTRGRALVLLDPHSDLAATPGPMGFSVTDAETSSSLGPLLDAWGVVYDPQQVVLDRGYALRAAVLEDDRRVERRYPLWWRAPPEAMSGDDLVTASLRRGVNVASAGFLAPADPDDAGFEALISTSADISVVDAFEAMGAPDPEQLARHAADPGAPRVLAARLSRTVTTAFPDGPPLGPEADADDADADAEPDATRPAAPPGRQEGEAEIILIADADFLDDQFYVQEDFFGTTTQADNAALALNAVDLLIGADALVSLRSRALSDRPMTRIEAIRARAEASYYARQLELEDTLAAAEARLAELRAQRGEEGSFLSALGTEPTAEERVELDRVVGRIAATRGELREVQAGLLAEIEGLRGWLVFFNVWLAPIAIAVFGVWMVSARRRARGVGGAS